MQQFYSLYLFALLAANTAIAQGNLYLPLGTSLHTVGSATITLANAKLTNNGTVNATAATLRMTGNAANADAAIGGTGNTALGHLTIDKTANSAQVNQNISVAGNLTLASGGVELAAGNIDFGAMGSLQAETETNRVYGTGGYLQATQTLNAPSGANPANLGAMLTSAQNFGSTVIKRNHIAITQTATGIARDYEIHPTNNTGLNATLRFHYFDAELNGNDESTMVLWRSVNGSTNWIAQTVATRNTSQNWIETSDINAFSSWTAANGGALPVKLLAFTGFRKGNKNVLNWVTATEQNNKGFEVETSANGSDFKNIGWVAGAGNSNVLQTYTFTDHFANQSTTQNSQPPISYYRLKQFDFDGHFEYSNTIFIKNTDIETLVIYPNPTNDIVTISVETYDRELPTELRDIHGKLIYSYKSVPYQIDLSTLPAAVYLLQIGGNVRKVVKE
jgi:hypothetical protein